MALLALLLAAGTSAAWGQNALRDTLNIRFKIDSTEVNLNFDGNSRSWWQFRRDFETRFADYSPDSIRLDIYSGASPEASAAHNEKLVQGSGESIRNLVMRTYPGRIGKIVVHNEGARWEGLYQAIAASDEPWKDEVLAIIRKPAGTNRRARDPRESELRTLHGGAVWSVLLDKYLPPLRSGASAILSLVRPEPEPVPEPEPSPEPEPNPGPTAAVPCPNCCDTIVVKEVHFFRDTVVMYYVPGSDARKEKVEADQSPVWAVKSNLPLLAAMAPNVQVEIPLGDSNHWSLEGEAIFPWWTFQHHAYSEELLNFGLEIRYWPGRRIYHPCLDGWHIGLAGAFGYYDLGWKSKGYQGEHVNAYFNFGWQHRWGYDKRWGLDMGIGFGAIITPRHRYYIGSSLFPENHTEEHDYHLMYQEHGDNVLPGPTHANVTLMYFLDWNTYNKKGVRR